MSPLQRDVWLLLHHVDELLCEPPPRFQPGALALLEAAPGLQPGGPAASNRAVADAPAAADLLSANSL